MLHLTRVCALSTLHSAGSYAPLLSIFKVMTVKYRKTNGVGNFIDALEEAWFGAFCLLIKSDLQSYYDWAKLSS